MELRIVVSSWSRKQPTDTPTAVMPSAVTAAGQYIALPWPFPETVCLSLVRNINLEHARRMVHETLVSGLPCSVTITKLVRIAKEKIKLQTTNYVEVGDESQICFLGNKI